MNKKLIWHINGRYIGLVGTVNGCGSPPLRENLPKTERELELFSSKAENKDILSEAGRQI